MTDLKSSKNVKIFEQSLNSNDSDILFINVHFNAEGDVRNPKIMENISSHYFCRTSNKYVIFHASIGPSVKILPDKVLGHYFSHLFYHFGL